LVDDLREARAVVEDQLTPSTTTSNTFQPLSLRSTE